MVWTCSPHVGDIRREILKILLVHTRGEDETWISQKTEQRHFQVLRANYERNNGHLYAVTAVTSNDDDGDIRK